jgi:hypothetical protein
MLVVGKCDGERDPAGHCKKHLANNEGVSGDGKPVVRTQVVKTRS